MDGDDLLHTFLQTYLANEANSVTFLPSILSGLSACDVEGSLHLSKWVNKVNSLIQSKDAGIRWAGLCLALKTSRLARSVLLGSGQGWVTVVLPMLSKADNPVTYRAAIRLLTYVFTSTLELPEFQRQVSTPNVPKFSSSIISLTEKVEDVDLKVYCMEVLHVMVQGFPTLHRPLAARLSSFSLGFLNGSPASVTPEAIIRSASRLHASLHNTGGKVGGSALWRKSLDETITFCNESLTALRNGPTINAQHRNDPMAFTNINIDKLRCGVELLCCLLSTQVSRPVLVPVKALVLLCTSMLSSTSKDGADDVDLAFRMLSESLRVQVNHLACKLTSVVATCIGKQLGPEQPRLLSLVAFSLESSQPSCLKLPLVRLIPALLGTCFCPADPLVVGRIIKQLLPTLAQLFPQKSSTQNPSAQVRGNKKMKKRVQGYEGDEVFKSGNEIALSSPEGELVISALDALAFLLRTPDLPEYLQSLTSRVLLSLLILLPSTPTACVSHDPTLHQKILSRVKEISLELASSPSGSVLSKSLPIIVGALGSEVNLGPQSVHERLIVDLMLHPRLPPLLRPLPHLNEIALTSAEEGAEEKKLREAIGLTDSLAISERDGSSVGIPPPAPPVLQEPLEEHQPISEPQAIHSTSSAHTTNPTSLSSQPGTVRSEVQIQVERRVTVEKTAHLDAPPVNVQNIGNRDSDVEMQVEDAIVSAQSSVVATGKAIGSAKDPAIEAKLAKAPEVKVNESRRVQDSMAVDEDDDDDDGNIVIPPLSMASDSESEG